MSLENYLQDCSAHYDVDQHLIWVIARTPGYHTRIKDGTKAYSTRDNMDYALGLLQRGKPDDLSRAHDIIETILPLQETNPTDQHYGIWGWFCEERPQQMNPADWNWADFIGARIAQMLTQHASQLKPDTAEKLRVALGHASRSIIKRNVQPNYTNIAIMGAVVTAAAGEILSDKAFLEYGRIRLARVLQVANETGGFTEYNSPTYTRVALEEVERALLMIKDPATRDSAEKLRHLAWRMLAERFHPATGQMAGPHARAYSDWIPGTLAHYLAEQTGAAVQPHEAPGKTFSLGNSHEHVRSIACPDDLKARFKKLPTDPYEVTTRFAIDPKGDIIGTTWLSGDACVGSVNNGIGWIQQRVMIGYWRTPEDSAICLKSQMLLNGHELSSSRCRQMQKGPRILSVWQLLTNSGHHHPNLNRAEGSVFEMTELVMSISIQGRGIDVRALGENRFELAAGDWRAVVSAAAGEFLDRTIVWEVAKTDGAVAVQAVLYRGPAKRVDFHHAPLKAACALELLGRGQQASVSPVSAAEQADGRILWSWNDLSVTSPVESEPF